MTMPPNPKREVTPHAELVAMAEQAMVMMTQGSLGFHVNAAFLRISAALEMDALTQAIADQIGDRFNCASDAAFAVRRACGIEP